MAHVACSVPDCARPATPFLHFPTVVGYCAGHGGVVADFLTFIDCPAHIGFDAHRARWEVRVRAERVASGGSLGMDEHPGGDHLA